MKKTIVIVSLLFGAILVSTKSKADSDVFLNLGIGVGLPAPVFVAPLPVVYSPPAFASASFISGVSSNTFLSFSIGVPAPVFVAPPGFAYPSVVLYPKPVFVHSEPIIIPRGHLPPPGEHRVWIPGRPPGHQPPPGEYPVFKKYGPKHIHIGEHPHGGPRKDYGFKDYEFKVKHEYKYKDKHKHKNEHKHKHK